MNTQKQTVVTDKAIVEVSTVETKDGKKPHDLIKEYVAEKFNTPLYNPVFDAAYKIGLEFGTYAYDKAMIKIFSMLNISEEEIDTMLKSNFK
jgi:glutathionyl-hydroquinone reductase